jgi:hypothetical protein
MGQSLFCEKAREVRAINLLCQFPREVGPTELLCCRPARRGQLIYCANFPASQSLGGGTRLPLSLTSPKKITRKAQEAPKPNIGANASRSLTKLR